MIENCVTLKEKDGEEHEEGEILDEGSPPQFSESEEQVESTSRVEADEAVKPAAVVDAATPPQSACDQDVAPPLRKPVGLDELSSGSEPRTTPSAQAGKRDVYAGRGREFEFSNEDDGSKSFKRNDWGAYGTNLYNFAWAQAVSSRPSFVSSGDSLSIGPSSKVSSDGFSSSGGGLGAWSSTENHKKLTREYTCELESFRRSDGRSTEEGDDMSPLRDIGSRTLERASCERDAIGRGRRIAWETSWSGRTEKLSMVESGTEKSGRGGLIEEEDYHRGHVDDEDGNWKKHSSESQSPNGPADEGEESRIRSPSTAIVELGQNGKVYGEADEREEGELEEGEIELGSVPAPKPSSSPKEPPNSSTRQSKYSGIKAVDYWAKDKNYARSIFTKSQRRSHIEGHSSRRHRQGKSQESHREKRLALAGDLVKNVTVKDAQKSFVDVCSRLHRALRVLDELHTPTPTSTENGRLESPPREIIALARQAFAGIRAVYAVRNTASGREQERDKNIFPRLLELANGYCQKLFTPKQTRELEVMMQTIAKAGRLVRDGAEKALLIREHQFQPVPKKNSDSDAKSGKSLGDNAGSVKLAPTQESKSSSENSIAGRILGIVDARQAEEAAAIAAAALAYAQSSAAARSSFGSTYDNRSSATSTQGMGPWGWLAENPSPGHFADPGANPLQPNSGVYNLPIGKYQPWNGTEQRQIKLGQDEYGGHFMESKASTLGSTLQQGTDEDVRVPPGYFKQAATVGLPEDEWEELSPPGSSMSNYSRLPAAPVQTIGVDIESAQLDTVLAYQNNVGNALHYPSELTLNLTQQRNRGNTNLYSAERLPSPTPDEDEDASPTPALPFLENKPGPLDVATKGAGVPSQHQGGGTRNSTLLPGAIHHLMRSQSLDGPGPVLESRIQKEKLVDPALLSGAKSLDHTEPLKIPNSLTHIGIFRSRDPRKRFHNNSLDLTDMYMDLNSQVIPGPHLSIGGARLPGIGRNKKRPGPESDDKQDVRIQKRLKGQSDSSGDVNGFIIDSLHVASGTGGWLDDNVISSLSTMEDLPMAMEVDDEVPSAILEGRNNAGADIRVKAGGQLDVFPDFLNYADVSKKQVKDSGQQTAETGQRKMKLRDPRRVFLENHVERGDTRLGDTPKANGVVMMDAKNSEGSPVTRGMPEAPEVPTRNKENTQAAKQVASLPSIASHFMEKLANIAGGISILPAATREQLVNSSGGQGLSCPVNDGSVGKDSGGVEAITGLNEVISQEIPEHQKEKPVALGVGRNPKGSPSHWGASQVHPHLEQLLGDLSEEDRLSVQRERQRRMEEQDRMFSAGKLCLVLDLDHTLLNSAKFSEIEQEWDQRLRVVETAEKNRTSRDGVERRELYRFPHMSMWTKLRPGIWKFLARASQLYELHVYTMGNKVYATEMAKLLDPTGKLFAGRVISKGDDGDGDDLLPKSKDLDGVLGMESAVVIIDDSARVWPHHSDNLIVVERYMYFPCSRRQFGLAGPSLLEVGHDERESDGMLASALGVIDRIHQSFFKNPRLREIDVREILAAQQRQVLVGCRVVFSRVFPVGEAEPHRHPLWRTAEQFGAICNISIDEQVTHVVAISLGTDKVNWALETGRHVVRPAWLEASTILYRRANERDFPVLPQ